MVDEYEAALQNSTCRKEHDEERKFQAGQCFDKLEQEDKVLVRNLAPRGGPGKLRPYWEPEIAEVVSRYKNDVTYGIKSKSYPNKTRVLHHNMLMPVTHLLDTIATVPTISPMKNKDQGAEDPGVTTSSSEESDSEYELEFTPNQILHLH